MSTPVLPPPTDTQTFTPHTTSRSERMKLLWRRIRETATLLGPSAKFLGTTEAHTYAYSVAANVLLAFLPFILLLVWLSQQALSKHSMDVIKQLVETYLPAGQDVIYHDVRMLTSHRSVQLFSFIMLAVSSSGVFLPLEVALNGIWGFKKNRSYVWNQLVALGLVAACAALAYASIQLSSLAQIIFHAGFKWQWSQNLLWPFFDKVFLQLFAWPATILSFFLVYWWLPNGKVPPLQVLPAALYTGLLAEVFITVFRWMLPLLDFRSVYASFDIAVTLLVWGYVGALLLLFGASLSARGVVAMPNIRRRLFHSAASAAK
jgi:YihY family inner membrane protein